LFERAYRSNPLGAIFSALFADDNSIVPHARAPPILDFRFTTKIQNSEERQMKNYRDSDYAANKFSEGIVYRFADETVVVTLEDYLRENPGKTEADFAALKALSDEMFLEQDRSEYQQTWKDVSLLGLSETEQCGAPPMEDDISGDDADTEADKLRRQIGLAAFNKLTEVQRRRYILHRVKGLTIRKIAVLEGVFFTSVFESLQAAEKKIKKILDKG
jgi:hypothetical protein